MKRLLKKLTKWEEKDYEEKVDYLTKFAMMITLWFIAIHFIMYDISYFIHDKINWGFVFIPFKWTFFGLVILFFILACLVLLYSIFYDFFKDVMD